MAENRDEARNFNEGGQNANFYIRRGQKNNSYIYKILQKKNPGQAVASSLAEKVTVMVLKVDLQCSCCYKKVKKTLCKFPQIRDQVYDEKANTVTITVICCSPEKIRDKLCCKGGKTIKSIEIKEPKKAEKPKEPEKPKEAQKPKQSEKPKETEKPKVVIIEKPKEPEKPKVVIIEKPKEPEKPKEAEKPKADGKGDKPKSNGAPPADKPAEKPKEGPKPEPAKVVESAPMKGPEPVPIGVPSVFPYCGPSYDGYNAGPYYFGAPPPPQPCYEGYYGYGHGYGRDVHVSRNDGYYGEENQGCSIM